MLHAFNAIVSNGLVNIAQDSSFLVRSFRQLIQDLSKPMLLLFWGILALVSLDVFQQLQGGAGKYGYMAGKVMLEAFFYSLFFAIWNDYFQRKKLHSHLKTLNTIRQSVKHTDILKYVNEPKYLMGVYFFINNVIIVWYVPLFTCIVHSFISCILLFYIMSFFVPCNVNESHVYVNTRKSSQSIDAIIKWDYSYVQNSSNWVILK